MRVLVWKEYREQRATMIALAALSVGLLIWLSAFSSMFHMNGEDRDGLLRFAAVLMIWLAGLVSGAMLLAGEREGRTLAFLDAQPSPRRQVWKAKTLAGTLFLLAQFLFIVVLSLSLRLFDGMLRGEPQLFVFLLFVAGWIGFSGGLFFSSICRHVITAIVLAIPTTLIHFSMLVGLAYLLHSAVQELDEGYFVYVALEMLAIVALAALILAMLLLPLTTSAHLFATHDRQRAHSVRPASWHSAVRSLWWLSARQFRKTAMVVLLVAVILGAMLPTTSWVLWPVATLLLGVTAGVLAFADEQSSDTERFFAAQRLPLGQVWLMKVGLCAALAFVAMLILPITSCLLVGTGVIVPRAMKDYPLVTRVFDSALPTEVFNPFLFYSLWVAYGFSFGHWCGLLFRKTVVAAVVATMLSGLCAVLWLPSLVGGGLHLFQVLGVPVILLLSARLLMPAWTAGRLAQRGPLRLLIGSILLSGFWLAGSIWLRVAEFPPVPVPADLAVVESQLSKLAQNESGSLIRRSHRIFQEIPPSAWIEDQQEPAPPAGGPGEIPGRLQEPAPPAGGPGAMPGRLQGPGPAAGPAGPGMPGPLPGAAPPAGGPGAMPGGLPEPGPAAGAAGGMAGAPPPGDAAVLPLVNFRNQLEAVLNEGWPKNDQKLSEWLDRMVTDEWTKPLAAAAELPVGLVIDPRQLVLGGALGVDGYQEMSRLLIVRSLREQARGNAANFVEVLRTNLALSRNLRNRAYPFVAVITYAMERRVWQGLDRWLERLNGQPELLQQALLVIQHHLSEPAELLDEETARYLMVINSCDHIPEVIQRQLLMVDPRSKALLLPLDLDLVAFAYQVPWERERLRRIFWAASGGSPMATASVQEGAPRPLYRLLTPPKEAGRSTPIPFQLFGQEPLVQARAAMLRVALRLYQIETGKPAETLDVLVPRFLKAVPLDPFSQQPFHYRLSQGEQIEWPEQPNGIREVPAGQGVLWSVGLDGQDDGGQKSKADLVFLVPLPPKK